MSTASTAFRARVADSYSRVVDHSGVVVNWGTALGAEVQCGPPEVTVTSEEGFPGGSRIARAMWIRIPATSSPAVSGTFYWDSSLWTLAIVEPSLCGYQRCYAERFERTSGGRDTYRRRP